MGFWASPPMVGAAWIMAVLGHERATGVAAFVVGGVSVAGATVVLRSGSVEAEVGPAVGIVLGTAALALGTLLALGRTRR